LTGLHDSYSSWHLYICHLSDMIYELDHLRTADMKSREAMSWLERRTGIARSRVQIPFKSWIFQASRGNCKNCVHNCEDHRFTWFFLPATKWLDKTVFYAFCFKMWKFFRVKTMKFHSSCHPLLYPVHRIWDLLSWAGWFRVALLSSALRQHHLLVLHNYQKMTNKIIENLFTPIQMDKMHYFYRCTNTGCTGISKDISVHYIERWDESSPWETAMGWQFTIRKRARGESSPWEKERWGESSS